MLETLRIGTSMKYKAGWDLEDFSFHEARETWTCSFMKLKNAGNLMIVTSMKAQKCYDVWDLEGSLCINMPEI